MSIIEESIGKSLKKRRLELNLSQAQVAEMTGYSTSSIRNMERGNVHVLVNRYARYAHELGFTLQFSPVEKTDCEKV